MKPISASIVVYSSIELKPNSNKLRILQNMLTAICSHELIEWAMVIDNSPKPFFENVCLDIKRCMYHHACGINLGFGAANNLAKRVAPCCSYHLIINPDIIMTDVDVLSDMYRFMCLNPKVSISQPLIRSEDGKKIQYLCKRNPTLMIQVLRGFTPFLLKNMFRPYNEWYEMRDIAYLSSPVETQYLSGAFMFCRRSVLDKVKWFDEKYFMYLEDADLTRRASEHGPCIHVPTTCVRHVWARGSHNSWKLRIIAIKSYFYYAFKWGPSFF